MTRSPNDSSPVSAQAIQEWLVSHISKSLDLDAEKLDVTADFTDYGLNSAEMINISGELEVYLGRSLDPTMVLDYPNIASLSEYLAEQTRKPVPQKSESQGDDAQAMLANLDQMSDDEVEGLLESLLSE